MRSTLVILSSAGGIALSLFAGLAYGQGGAKPAATRSSLPSVPPKPASGLSPSDAAAFEQRFTNEIWPLLERAKGGCITCHGANNPSQLHFAADGAGSNFKKLLGHGFFEPESPSGILARVASPLANQRMPPAPQQPWSEAEVAKLRAFVGDLYDRTHASGARADELFPAELHDPYTGKAVSSGPDNTFLTYRQLKRKIEALFQDDWHRGGKDLFQENLAQFGGADFVTRFDESHKPTATFLSAVDTLARDVASRAYLASTGPFAGRAESLPSPVKLAQPTPAYRSEITRLYRKLLFRSPSENEVRQAYGFVRNIYTAQASVAAEGGSLDFELAVSDDLGNKTIRPVRVRLTTETAGLYQEYLDQNAEASQPEARKQLNGAFTFQPQAAGQMLELDNANTHGNVSFAGIELKGPLPLTTAKRISVSDPGVVVQGAWQRREANGFVSFEDGDTDKGSSRIQLPIDVPTAGKYELSVLWRKSGSVRTGRGRNRAGVDNAEGVLVEVYSADPSSLANPPLPPTPPKGEAHFVIDETVDNIPYWDLETLFRFSADPTHGLEIKNEGTKRRVTADSVKFEAAEKGGTSFVLDDPQAEGKWPAFVVAAFEPYNQVGSGSVTDNNERKGEMKLLFQPSKSPQWKSSSFYRVFFGFPGKVDNETEAPLVVQAEASSPIVRISAPPHADAGATVTLDASGSYNVQHGPLKYAWQQLGGPRVRLADPHAAKVTFQVDAMSPQQAAWEGLCRALLKHPDFLFTRPRSLAQITDKTDRRRLHLLKIAQDLVGRPPSDIEVKQLEGGAPLSKLIDQYLESAEFRDFYFHRVRLVLESRGTEQDDEPVRLWSYVVANDRPFKEILTADYTVDAQLHKQSRPEYHGKTGLLTMKGFIAGKPGLPHFNYAAMVTEKFLGYVYEVPPSVIAARDSIAAASTTSPTSVCYSCHKVLTPLAYQRLAWDDNGNFKPQDAGKPVDDTDRGLVPSYPFRGKGMEAFALQSVNKERFIRTMIQTHFVMFFGREMRYQDDERGLYKRLWDDAAKSNYNVKRMLRSLMTSSEYLGLAPATAPGKPSTGKKPVRSARG
jgi:hypothetical protein